MNKIILKISTIVLGLVVFCSAGAMLLREENEKRQYKNDQLKNYYSNTYEDWIKYKSEYDDQILKLKKENIAHIQELKKSYEDLLLQQPSIIAQHTKSIATNSLPQSQVNSPTVKKNIVITKPKSTPQTRSS